ncbi:MAG: HD domain-containing protein [Pseudomonadota bacterium]
MQDREASIQALERLFEERGQATYGEAVTQIAHAEQTAACAVAEGAPETLVAAALLHDVGHLIADNPDRLGHWNHAESGATYLAAWFLPDVTEPIRLHVAAKRYLCAVEPEYLHQLSEASTQSLAQQGGPFTPDQAARFIDQPFAAEALRLRRWDEGGKVEGQVIQPVSFYRALLARCLQV